MTQFILKGWIKTQLYVWLKFARYNGCDHFINLTVVKNKFIPIKISQHHILIFLNLSTDKVLAYLYGGAKQWIIYNGIVFWGIAYDSFQIQSISSKHILLCWFVIKKYDEPSYPIFFVGLIVVCVYGLQLFIVECKHPSNESNYKTKLMSISKFPIPKPASTFFTKTFILIVCYTSFLNVVWEGFPYIKMDAR